MAAKLPLEIVFEIASFVALARDEAFYSRGKFTPVSLAPFTTVSSSWQAMFEPHIYRKLHVYSKEIQKNDPRNGRNRTLTCKRLDKITSGPPYRVLRRRWIREMAYYVVIPHHLHDYTRAALDGYSPDNEFRRANDCAFSDGVVALFDVLSSWNPDSAHVSATRISIELELYGESKYRWWEPSEPNTEFEQYAGGHFWNYMDGETRSVLPYRARFSPDSPSLPDVSCVSCIAFTCDCRDNGIWPAASFNIIQHCIGLQETFLDLDYYIRPDQVVALRERREAVANGLHQVPRSMRSFTCLWHQEYHWKENMDGPNVLPASAPDSLSIGLRNLSLQLRELHVIQLRVTPDLFWPSDVKLGDKPDLTWPYMEVLIIENVPFVTPTGKWMQLPDDPADLVIDDMDSNIIDDDQGGVERSRLDTEAFHALYVAAGNAAVRMPRLRLFRIDFDRDQGGQLLQLAPTPSGSTSLDCVSSYGYQPSSEVCQAWGFRPDQLQQHESSWQAEFDTWPPER